MLFSITIPAWSDVAFKPGAVVTYANRTWRATAIVPAASGPPPAGALWEPFVSYMSWQGVWVDGVTYYKNDVSRDGAWTGVANKTTLERPGAILTGNPYYVYAGTMSSKQETEKQYFFGNRYTFLRGGYLNGWRIDVVAGFTYTVYAVDDPEGVGQITQLITFTATTSGWVEFGISPILVKSGSVLELVAKVNEPSPTPTTWTGDWDYKTPNNAAIPLAGDIQHANKLLDSLRINVIDDNGGNRAAELAALTVGDQISGAGMTWAIQAITDNTTWFDFTVTPAQQGIDGVNTFTFETVVATPITVPYDLDYWLNTGQSNIKGIEGSDVNNLPVNNNAYGIDILVQEATISEDWDILVPPGNIAG